MSLQVFKIEGKEICINYDFFFNNLKKYFKEELNIDYDENSLLCEEELIYKAFNKIHNDHIISINVLDEFEKEFYLNYYNLANKAKEHKTTNSKLMILLDRMNGEYVCLMYPKKAESIENTMVYENWQKNYRKKFMNYFLS